MSDDSAQGERIKLWNFRRALQLVISVGLWVAAIFVSAGTWRWLRGWICVVTTLGMYAIATVLVQTRNPALIEARAKWLHRDTKRSDKLFMALFFALYYFQPVVAGLDAVRYHWSSMPFATVYTGAVLLIGAMSLVTWAMVVNRFAETTVRIQSEKQHEPVTAGPYSIVRHPMYVGMIVMFVAIALILGSVWALVVGVVMAALVVWRTAMEDRTLRSELPGYKEFAAEVTRYRLLPGVW